MVANKEEKLENRLSHESIDNRYSSDNFKEEKESVDKEMVNRGENRYEEEENSQKNSRVKKLKSPSNLYKNLKKANEEKIPKNKIQKEISNKESNSRANNQDSKANQNLVEYDKNKNSLSNEYRPEMSFGRTASGRKIPVEERTLLWKAKKESKIKNTRDQIKNEFIEDCTFKPKLFSNNSNTIYNSKVISEVSLKSIEKHIKRKKEIIYQQDKDKEKEKICVGQGKNWKNELTVPKLFKFQQNQEEIKALLKPVDCANSPSKRSSIFINKRTNNNSGRYSNYIEEMNKKEDLIDKPMNFDDARDILHSELMKLELENPNF